MNQLLGKWGSLGSRVLTLFALCMVLGSSAWADTLPSELLLMNGMIANAQVRESPTLHSNGQTSIMDLGGGQFHVNSFFDVFFELSLDGGQTWTPGAGPGHLTFSDTEMVQLDLSTGGGILIRESPTHLSGSISTTVTPLAGGQFQVNSFFDVFTELSFDGGQTWMPAGDQPISLMQITAPGEVATPEPGSLALLGSGLLMAGRRVRRSGR